MKKREIVSKEDASKLKKLVLNDLKTELGAFRRSGKYRIDVSVTYNDLVKVPRDLLAASLAKFGYQIVRTDVSCGGRDVWYVVEKEVSLQGKDTPGHEIREYLGAALLPW